MRPVITIDPAVRFGYPQIRGIPTDAIAGMLWAGEDAETVCHEYDITRRELVMACWFEAEWRLVGAGPAAWRKAWRQWAKDVFRPLASGTAAELIPMPPDKDGNR